MVKRDSLAEKTNLFGNLGFSTAPALIGDVHGRTCRDLTSRQISRRAEPVKAAFLQAMMLHLMSWLHCTLCDRLGRLIEKCHSPYPSTNMPLPVSIPSSSSLLMLTVSPLMPEHTSIHP